MNKLLSTLSLLSVILFAASCTKDQENRDMEPYIYPTDMLFEDLTLDRFSYKIPDADFTTGIATFNVVKENNDWSGFAISNHNLRTFVYNEAHVDSIRFSAYTGSYPHAGGNFLVVKPKGDNAEVNFSRPVGIEKMLITNTTQVWQTIMYGTGTTSGGISVKTYSPTSRILTTARKDYVRVKIKGYNGNTETGEVLFYLADRNSITGKLMNFTVADWMPVSLDSLGPVTKLRFYMESTDVTNDVVNTPPYFCIDGIRFKEAVY